MCLFYVNYAHASIGVPWTASSTDQGFASPVAINGGFPSVLIGATSTSATQIIKLNGNATSTYANGINAATNAGCIAFNGTCLTSNSGTVTSVNGSGGTTGLTLTGGAITTSGILTLGGTLGIANGGTATTTYYNKGVNFFDGTRITQAAGSGSSILNWDNTNGFLGIGTTTPYAPLSITSNLATQATMVLSGNQPLFQIGSGSPPYGYLANDRLNVLDNRNDYSVLNVNNVSAGACATADVSTANDLAANATNFVDIGHTSSGFTGVGCANNPFTGFGANSSYIFDPSGDLNLSLPIGNFKWFTGNHTVLGQKAVLTNAGRFGIGTTTPTATLSVNQASSSPTIPGIVASYSIEANNDATTTYFSAASSSIPKTGIGTSTPTAALVVTAASTTVATVQTGYNGVVAIIGGYENTTFKAFQTIDQWGHQIIGGDSPALSSCGTSPSFVGAANDNAFTIQVGSVAATGCTATFAHAWPTAPTCVVSEKTGSITNIASYTVSATAFVYSQTGLTGDILDVHCTGTQ